MEEETPQLSLLHETAGRDGHSREGDDGDDD